MTGINGAHGTAIAEKTGHGFATSGNDSSVVMFDLATYKVLGRAHAAEDADAIIYDPASNRVFTFNGDAHSSTVIDPVSGKTITNIDLGGKPEYGVSAGDGKVYANLTDNGEVVEIDAKTLKVTRRWSTAPCKNPVSMAIDVEHHRLFSGCRSGVMAVSDYAAGKIVTTVPIGTGVDGAGYDPLERKRVRVERRRHAHRDPRGHAGHVSRRGDRADDARLAEHGPRPDDAPDLSRRREIRRGAGKRRRPPRAAADGARIVRRDGGRAKPVEPNPAPSTSTLRPSSESR